MSFLTDLRAVDRFPALAGRAVVVEAVFAPGAFTEAEFERHGIPLPAAIAGAVDRRKAEFLAGRLCARHALGLGGFAAAQVGVRHDRSPIWPPGAVGSITHTDRLAAVVVGRRELLSGLGIDYEPSIAPETAAEVEPIILTEADRRFAASLAEWPRERFLGAVFSLKESLFKALYPRVGFHFDFQVAEVAGWGDGRAVLRLVRGLSADYPEGREFEAAFADGGEMIRSVVAVPAGGE